MSRFAKTYHKNKELRSEVFVINGKKNIVKMDNYRKFAHIQMVRDMANINNIIKKGNCMEFVHILMVS